MLETVANAIWHVFNFLDDKNTGLVVKSRLKVTMSSMQALNPLLKIMMILF
jgi:hypothetical protein